LATTPDEAKIAKYKINNNWKSTRDRKILIVLFVKKKKKKRSALFNAESPSLQNINLSQSSSPDRRQPFFFLAAALRNGSCDNNNNHIKE
jgi:hypothetical protein